MVRHVGCVLACIFLSIGANNSFAGRTQFKNLYSCKSTGGGSVLEALKKASDFEVALAADGRAFAFSPSNLFTQEVEPGKVKYNVGHLRIADISKNPDLLSTAFEVELLPLSQERVAAYQNLSSGFSRDFEQPVDMTLKYARGVTYDVGGHEYPFSNVMMARSKYYGFTFAFMSDDGSRYFLTHVCN